MASPRDNAVDETSAQETSSPENPSPVISSIRYLRPIIIDGLNLVALPNAGGVDVQRCIWAIIFFRKLGHSQILVLFPRTFPWRRLVNTSNEQRLKCIEILEAYVDYSPARNMAYRSNDDLYLLDMAKNSGGVIISNDQFREEIAKDPSFADLVENRVLQYSIFFEHHFLVAQDPRGKSSSIRLEDVLRFPPGYRPATLEDEIEELLTMPVPPVTPLRPVAFNAVDGRQEMGTRRGRSVQRRLTRSRSMSTCVRSTGGYIRQSPTKIRSWSSSSRRLALGAENRSFGEQPYYPHASVAPSALNHAYPPIHADETSSPSSGQEQLTFDFPSSDQSADIISPSLPLQPIASDHSGSTIPDCPIAGNYLGPLRIDCGVEKRSTGLLRIEVTPRATWSVDGEPSSLPDDPVHAAFPSIIASSMFMSSARDGGTAHDAVSDRPVHPGISSTRGTVCTNEISMRPTDSILGSNIADLYAICESHRSTCLPDFPPPVTPTGFGTASGKVEPTAGVPVGPTPCGSDERMPDMVTGDHIFKNAVLDIDPSPLVATEQPGKELSNAIFGQFPATTGDVAHVDNQMNKTTGMSDIQNRLDSPVDNVNQRQPNHQVPENTIQASSQEVNPPNPAPTDCHATSPERPNRGGLIDSLVVLVEAKDCPLGPTVLRATIANVVNSLPCNYCKDALACAVIDKVQRMRREATGQGPSYVGQGPSVDDDLIIL